MPEQNNITNSLAHTKWNCKYKGKSSLMIYQKWGNMKFAKQLKQDKEADQLSVFDPNDPFKGSK